MTMKDPINKVIPMAAARCAARVSSRRPVVGNPMPASLPLPAAKGSGEKRTSWPIPKYAFSRLGKSTDPDADLGQQATWTFCSASHPGTTFRMLSEETRPSSRDSRRRAGEPANPAGRVGDPGADPAGARAEDAVFFGDLDRLIDDMDILLIDTAAGISSNVMDFVVMAHEIIVVVFSRSRLINAPTHS